MDGCDLGASVWGGLEQGWPERGRLGSCKLILFEPDQLDPERGYLGGASLDYASLFRMDMRG